MKSNKLACLLAAGLVGTALTFSSSQAFAAPTGGEVVVKGKKIDPELQRQVSYADLNLAFRSDQNVLRGRIHDAAGDICLRLNANFDSWRCTIDAVYSTKDQFAAAVTRAKLKMAGKPVGPAIAISMVIGAR